MRNGPGVEERGILKTASYDKIVGGGVPVAKLIATKVTGSEGNAVQGSKCAGNRKLYRTWHPRRRGGGPRRPSSQTREGGLRGDESSGEGGQGYQRGGYHYNRGGQPRRRPYWSRYYSGPPRNHQDGDGEEQPNAEEVGQNSDQRSQRRGPQRFYRRFYRPRRSYNKSHGVQQAEIRVNVVEAREHAPAIVGDSIGTLPSISPADMRELQKSDDGLQRVIWYRHRGRHRGMRERSDESKARHDRHALELPLAAGERVYLRKHGVLGRNKIQDVWQPTPYRVVMRQGTNDVYMVEPADGFGQQHTVNRAALRLCVSGYNPTAAQPARRRRLPCPPSVTSAGSDDTSDTSSAPLLWTVRDQVDSEEASSASPVSDSSSMSDNEEEDVRPVTLRRTCRTRAGTHTNPGNWPRSAKR